MVKIITSSISHQDLEDKINEWNISNRKIVSISFSITPMHDNYDDGRFCNQWTDYTAIIIY
jgi:hypothetical protein